MLFMTGVLFTVHCCYLMRNKNRTNVTEETLPEVSSRDSAGQKSPGEKAHRIEPATCPPVNSVLAFAFHICLEEKIGKVPSLCMHFLPDC